MRVGSAILLAVLSLLIFAGGMAAKDKEHAQQVSEFGRTKDGAVIHRYVLSNKSNFEAVVISYGEDAHVHRTYISSIELGKVNVGVEIANQVALALGMKLSDLIRKVE